jgi:hypothetical protein
MARERSRLFHFITEKSLEGDPTYVYLRERITSAHELLNADLVDHGQDPDRVMAEYELRFPDQRRYPNPAD